MHVLFPTGSNSSDVLASELRNVSDFTYEIVITGEVASFLTPASLSSLIKERSVDCVVVSGMCTADFSSVEKEFGVPVFRGTRHAADMHLCLSGITAGTLSRTQAADVLLEAERTKEARKSLVELEESAAEAFSIRGVKFGKNSRIKVIAEIMDAHRNTNLLRDAEHLLESGADGIDLGFGFDATPNDVKRCFSELANLDCILSIDTLDPNLIRASLFRVDLIFSLTLASLPVLAAEVKKSGAAAVILPCEGLSLSNIVQKARDSGLTKLFADPLLQPPLSGMTSSLAGYLPEYGAPKIMGCVNVVELIDADSPGICSLLAVTAAETHCAAVLVSEHSDKTQGACKEMRLATEQMQLSRNRPYPKDAGIDTFVIKEKRKRREPALKYDSARDVSGVSENLSYDPRGSFRIGIEGDKIVAVRHGKAIRGSTAEEVFTAILEEKGVSLLDHAAYLGKELYKAELAIRYGRSFEQDGKF